MLIRILLSCSRLAAFCRIAAWRSTLVRLLSSSHPLPVLVPEGRLRKGQVVHGGICGVQACTAPMPINAPSAQLPMSCPDLLEPPQTEVRVSVCAIQLVFNPGQDTFGD